MAIICTVAPFNVETATRPTLGFSDSDDKRLTALGPFRFFPGISRAPTLNREGWNGDFGNGVFLPQAAVNVNLNALKAEDPNAPAYRWTGAPFLIYRGEPGDAWEDFELLFSGLVLSSAAGDGTLKLTAQVNSEPFEEKVLTLEYDGFGGPGGVDDLKERMKPAVFGNAENIEPVPIDLINNVFQVHGYGPIQAIRHVYERGVMFRPAVADYPSYATLVQATIPEGYYATCLAEGMFRLGAPPFGLITVDVAGDNTGGFHQTTAAIMRRLCEIGNVPADSIDDASLDAFEAQVPYPINLYVTNPDKLIDQLATLALPCNAHASLSWLGKLQVTRFADLPGTTMRLDAQGRELPPVLDNAEQAVSAPFYRLELQYGRSWRVHSKEELVTDEDLTDVPITIWRAYPDQPPTPFGDEIPAGWHDFKPEMSRPYVDSEGQKLFGPVWESHAVQRGGVTTVAGWSEPRLDDSRYKGFLLSGRQDDDRALGGADSIRVDANGFNDARWIRQPLAGPFRLRWFVRSGLTRFAAGISFVDPETIPDFNPDHIHTGIAATPAVAAFGHPADGFYPFTNFQRSGGYVNAEWNRSHLAVPTFSEYALISNGELIELYVNRERQRTFVVDRDLLGDTVWPVFYLEGWDQSFGTDSDIYGIEWSHGTPARILEFPVDVFTGALRRLASGDGWQINAPYMGQAENMATIEAKEFKGGGRMDFRYSSNSTATSATTSVIQLSKGSSNVGKFELDANGNYRAKVGSTTVKSGTWVDGDTFSINYFGRYVSLHRNGTMLALRTTGTSQTVAPRFTLAKGGSLRDIYIEPANEAAYEYKGSVLATSFANPLQLSNPQNPDGYTIIGTTADLGYSVSDAEGGDLLRVKATFAYYWYSGGSWTAPFYLPDAKIEVSYDAGASWEYLPGTWAPSPAQAATQGGPNITPLVFTPTADIVPVGTDTIRARLVAKNTTAGTYDVTIMGTSYVQIEWVA